MAKTTTVNGGYTVKGLKTWPSRDGGGYCANLYHNGKKVGDFRNDGNGGPTVFAWVDKAHPSTMECSKIFKPETASKHALALAAYCDEQPKVVYDFAPEGLELDGAMFVATLVQQFESEKRLKRMLKTQLVWVRGGELYGVTYKRLEKKNIRVEMQREGLAKRHTDLVILNDMPFNDAAALCKKIGA